MTLEEIKKFRINLSSYYSYNGFVELATETDFVIKLLKGKISESEKESICSNSEILRQCLSGYVENPEEKVFGECIKQNNKTRKIKAASFFEAARLWSSEKKKISLDDLAYIYDNSNYFFFLGLNFEEKQLNSILNKINRNFEENVLKKCRSFSVDTDDFLKPIIDSYEAADSFDQVIKLMNPYITGEYIELPPAISSLFIIIYLKENISLLLRLLKTLQYFPLQGSILSMIRNPELLIKLLKSFKKNAEGKILTTLIKEKFFFAACKVSESLNQNLSFERLPKYLKREVEKSHQRWDDNLKNLINEFSIEVIRILGFESLVEWFVNLKDQFKGKDEKFIKPQLKFIHLLEEILKDLKPLNLPDDFSGLKIPQILFYVSENLSEKEGKDLIYVLCRKVYSKEFFLPLGVTDEAIEKFYNLAQLLIKYNIDGFELMKKYRQPREGYNVNRDLIYNSGKGDQFWLSVLAFVVEVKKNKNYLDLITSTILNLASDENWRLSDNYYQPLFFLELIVSQVCTDLKDEFEKQIIENISSVVGLLRILLANQGKISDEIKQILMKRINAEIEIEKLSFNDRMPNYFPLIEDYISKLS